MRPNAGAISFYSTQSHRVRYTRWSMSRQHFMQSFDLNSLTPTGVAHMPSEPRHTEMNGKESYLIYLNELHGWMTQCPAVFWRIRSFTNAFLLPNSFIANRLSVGWNHDCSWFFKKFDDIFSVNVCRFGNGSSFGVPYSETSSKWTWSVGSIDEHQISDRTKRTSYTNTTQEME